MSKSKKVKEVLKDKPKEIRYKYGIFNKEKYPILEVRNDEVLLEFTVDDKKVPQLVFKDCVILIEDKEDDIVE